MEQQVASSPGFQEYLFIFFKRWIPFTVTFIITCLLVAFYLSRSPKVYVAYAKILMQEREAEKMDLGQLTRTRRRAPSVANQIEIMKTRKMAFRIKQALKGMLRENPGLEHDQSYRYLMEMNLDTVRSSMSIARIARTDIFRITANARDAGAAKLLARVATEEFIRYNRQIQQEDSHREYLFISSQLDAEEIKLRKAEEELNSFRKRENIYEADKDYERIVTKVDELDFERMQTRMERSIASEQKSWLKEQVAALEKSMRSTDEDIDVDIISNLEKELIASELELTRKEDVYTPRHPEVLLARKKIDDLHNRIDLEMKRIMKKNPQFAQPLERYRELQSEIASINAKIREYESREHALGELQKKFDDRLQRLPAKRLDFILLKRKVGVAEKTQAYLLERLAESKISERGGGTFFTVIEPPQMPGKPVEPNIPRTVLIGLVLATIMGIAVIAGFEFIDNSIESVEDVHRVLDLPSLGVVPALKKSNGHSSRRKSREKEQRRDTVQNVLNDPKSVAAEAFRTIRTNIRYSRSGRDVHSLLVCSPGPQEGKSTTVANLAVTFARSGNKVLIVDTDLRKPVQHYIFNLERGPGITDVIVGDCKLEDAVRDTGFDKLKLLPCGTLPPNPAELVGGNEMDALLKQMKQSYDYVIFDSPPLAAVTDAQILGSLADGTLLVVYAGRTNREMARHARTLLDHTGANILGVLLNHFDISQSYGRGGYYRYYHRYYGNDESGTDDV